MPFLLMLCLSLACLPIPWPAPRYFANPWFILLGTTVLIAGVVVGARRIAAKTCRLLADPKTRSQALSYYGRRRTQHALLLMVAFVVALYAFGWGWLVKTSVQAQFGEQLVPAVELLIMAPLPLALLLSWVCFYDVERALLAEEQPDAKPFGGRGGYVSFQARQNLAMISAPLLIMMLVQGLVRHFPGTFDNDRAQVLLAVPFLGAAILFMPLGVRLLLNLRPLPAGPMRDRLEAAAKRLNCRCSDILVWNTRNGVMNAMVVGVVPQLRYILLSDRLLNEMTPEEVEAVFGHEAGHVKHRHMIYYLLFLIAGMAVMSGALAVLAQTWPAAKSWFEQNGSWLELTLSAAFIFSIFGFISRRCERQADVYGCKTVSCGQPDCPGHDLATNLVAHGGALCPEGVRVFCSALDKVALLSGMSRTRPGWLHSWQHSTIARRVDFLRRLGENPHLEPRFQRSLFWVKSATLALIVLSAGVLWLI